MIAAYPGAALHTVGCLAHRTLPLCSHPFKACAGIVGAFNRGALMAVTATRPQATGEASLLGAPILRILPYMNQK